MIRSASPSFWVRSTTPSSRNRVMRTLSPTRRRAHPSGGCAGLREQPVDVFVRRCAGSGRPPRAQHARPPGTARRRGRCAPRAAAGPPGPRSPDGARAAPGPRAARSRRRRCRRGPRSALNAARGRSQQLVLGALGEAGAANRRHGRLPRRTALAAARGEDGEGDGVDGVTEEGGEPVGGGVAERLGAEVALARGAFEDGSNGAPGEQRHAEKHEPAPARTAAVAAVASAAGAEEVPVVDGVPARTHARQAHPTTTGRPTASLVTGTPHAAHAVPPSRIGHAAGGRDVNHRGDATSSVGSGRSGTRIPSRRADSGPSTAAGLTRKWVRPAGRRRTHER